MNTCAPGFSVIYCNLFGVHLLLLNVLISLAVKLIFVNFIVLKLSQVYNYLTVGCILISDIRRLYLFNCQVIDIVFNVVSLKCFKLQKVPCFIQFLEG